MTAKRKMGIAGAIGIIVAGLLVISITAARSGALTNTIEKYNLLNMIDESKNVMGDLNTEMDGIKGNISVLNEKLDLLAEVNGLLDEQIAVVDKLNTGMSSQGPLLETANSKLDEVQSGINYTLSGIVGMKPTLESLLSGMGASIATTGAVVDGMAQMAGVGSVMSGQLDETLRYLAAMQPMAAKAHRAMGMIPLDITFLSSFLPTPAPAPAATEPQASAGQPADSGGSIPVVGPVLEGVGGVTGGLVQALTGLLFGR